MTLMWKRKSQENRRSNSATESTLLYALFSQIQLNIFHGGKFSFCQVIRTLRGVLVRDGTNHFGYYLTEYSARQSKPPCLIFVTAICLLKSNLRLRGFILYFILSFLPPLICSFFGLKIHFRATA
jgi:hypothetical protein